jgi:hypothetical protein
MIGPFQEADGSISMRRVLAAFAFLVGAACLILGTITKTLVGVYAGGVCLVAVLILLGLTTISDIKGVIASVRGGQIQPVGSPTT